MDEHKLFDDLCQRESAPSCRHADRNESPRLYGPKCLDCVFSMRNEPGSSRAAAAGKTVPAKLSLALPSAAHFLTATPKGS